MVCRLNQEAWERLVDENIEWLKRESPRSLERDHIIIMMQAAKTRRDVMDELDDAKYLVLKRLVTGKAKEFVDSLMTPDG